MPPSGHNYLIIGQSNADYFYSRGGVSELESSVTIDRIFFWQGESDVQIMPTAQWVSDFESMVSDLKQRFPGVQIYYVRLTSNALAANYIYWGLMHDAMTNLAGAHMVSSDGIDNSPMPFRADNPHYDAKGYALVADRLALELVGRF